MSQREQDMGSTTQEIVIAQAMAWHAALEADDADWVGFTAWLEADPAHARAFDAVALLDEMVEEHHDALPGDADAPPNAVPSLPAAANDAGVPFWRRPLAWASGAGIAAAAALALLVVGLPGGAPNERIIASKAGEIRTIALADNSHVTLAPGSRLAVSRDDPNQLSLTGSAVFDIRHRPDRQMTVRAGKFRITDIGTRFSVDNSDAALRIAVEDGKIAVHVPGAPKPLTLTAGHGLRYLADSNSLEMTTLAGNAFASWQHGSLVYRDMPLAVVAADISRYAGQRIVLDPAVADQRFSGVLGIGDGSKLADDLARLMDLSIETQGDHVRLAAGDSR